MLVVPDRNHIRLVNSQHFPTPFDFITNDNFICKAIKETGYWDKATRDVILQHLKPDWTFLDMGAHLGYFSLLAAQHCAHVIAVEPMPIPSGLLSLSVEANGFQNVHVVQAAVSDKDGEVDMQFVTGNTGESHRSTAGNVKVKALRARNLINGSWPEFIKMDIEGDEYLVLKSCPELLEHARVVVVELSEQQLRRNSGVGEQKVRNLLKDAGFRLTEIFRRPTYSDWLAIKKE